MARAALLMMDTFGDVRGILRENSDVIVRIVGPEHPLHDWLAGFLMCRWTAL